MQHNRLHRNALRRARKARTAIRVPDELHRMRYGTVQSVGDMWSIVVFANGATEQYFNRFIAIGPFALLTEVRK